MSDTEEEKTGPEKKMDGAGVRGGSFFSTFLKNAFGQHERSGKAPYHTNPNHQVKESKRSREWRLTDLGQKPKQSSLQEF